ncbi:MAG: DUF5675 family protein [Bacteroidota bacterium]
MYLNKMFRFIFRKGGEELEGQLEGNGQDSEHLLSLQEADLDEGILELHQNGQNGQPELLQVDLIRYSQGAYDILGKMYFNGHFQCFTLEGNVLGDEGTVYLPRGIYEVGLKTKGGKNATYFFRYQDMHRGMLHIQRGKDFPFSVIHEGNRYTDRKGSILVGSIPVQEKELGTRRELWFSDEAYAKIYPELADHLMKGGRIQLWIREEFQALLPQA